MKGGIQMEKQEQTFVSKISEEELKKLAGGYTEVSPQSTIVCVSLRICNWSLRFCPSFKVKCPM
jgi:hypothetical protein